MDKKDLFDKLNAETRDERIQTVKELKRLLNTGEIKKPASEGYTNNHVHTKFSFSPYSPSKAVWLGMLSGLDTVGIMDHDTVSGAEEFIEAGKILGIATTIGFEIRTDWTNTRLKGRRINNPDQIGNAYISAHGLPHTQIKKADKFLSTVRSAREQRNRAMTQRLNDFALQYGVTVDYDRDVRPLSYYFCGGEVTERHLLFAWAKKMISKYHNGRVMTDFLTNQLGINLGAKNMEYLLDEQNDMYVYDLLNVLKSNFIKKIYIDAKMDEAVPVGEAVSFIKSVGAIPSYCYLGDVGDSPTGDKKEQKFEDDYLEDVFDECKRIGFQAIAYMPSRNTRAQLERVMMFCDRYGFMQISGEDINQPRQSFICKQLKEPGYQYLIDTTWALVGHEKAATVDLQNGIFAGGADLNTQEMQERIQIYKRIGMNQQN